MEYIYKVNGNEYAVNIASIKGNKAQVLVNGIVYEVEMENASSCLAPDRKSTRLNSSHTS